jgi:SNF2 family DNA or RNA helicase
MSDYALIHPDKAKNFLWKFDSKTRMKGEEIFQKGGVRRLTCLLPGMAYSAMVTSQGTAALFEAKVSTATGECLTSCACRSPLDRSPAPCAHAYALIRTLILLHQKGGQAPAAARPAPVLNRPPDGALALKPGAKKKVTGDTEAPVKPAGPTLRELLIERLGRPLLNPEEVYLTKVATAFRATHGRTTITLDELSPLGLRPLGHGLNLAQLWPSPPTTEHEFWLYLVIFAGQHQLPMPDFMSDVSLLSEAPATFYQWQKERDVERWIGLFQETSRAAGQARASVIDFRLSLQGRFAQLESRRGQGVSFSPVKATELHQLQSELNQGLISIEPGALPLWLLLSQVAAKSHPTLSYDQPAHAAFLHQLLINPLLHSRIVGTEGQPLARPTAPLRCVVAQALAEPKPKAAPSTDTALEVPGYTLRLVQDDGATPPPLRFMLPGRPPLFIAEEAIFSGPPLPAALVQLGQTIHLPAAALETNEGVLFLERINTPPPPQLLNKIQRIPWRTTLTAEIKTVLAARGSTEVCVLELVAHSTDGRYLNHYGEDGWLRRDAENAKWKEPTAGPVIVYDRQAMHDGAKSFEGLDPTFHTGERIWTLKLDRSFAETFADWLRQVPDTLEIKLKGDLASLLDGTVSATVDLQLTPADRERDWFDLRVVLNHHDTLLTSDELKKLIDARGKWVRLGTKGWRRLQYEITEDDDHLLAKLGLTARDFSAAPQRLHTLQLADRAAERWLPAEDFEAIQTRAADIKSRVTPEVPASVKASLRPYQIEGFHFLAYLSENSFGGVLADDMGLGKTLQTLTWIEWLRQRTAEKTSVGEEVAPAQGVLVVCPKSVTDNWIAEVKKFLPHLTARRWVGTDLKKFPKEVPKHDIHVVNYAQLRSIGERWPETPFLACIMDEAQAIKNPSSDTAKSARAIPARHRLALSGTPIENKLLDLWSIMSFAMPGVLGPRGHFQQLFGAKDDPHARRRLSARLRPFLIRRTKLQVAQDLPDRIEEDLLCTIEGEQNTLYRAELKVAQQILLKISSPQELNRERFQVLTTLMRMRQICCDPRLIDPGSTAPSAKLDALLELLEPLLAEGQKVLIFSQFSSMLHLLEKDLRTRLAAQAIADAAETAAAQSEDGTTPASPAGDTSGPPIFLLTGQTENRGEMVNQFQATEGSALFLISLKAGGSGLNLTAASYVVLYDPWWNPAAEAQAIDRCHRIGQKQKVIAYRLLVKDSLEEKIRTLQKEKAALANDVLGDEQFSEALSITDLQTLFG